jgi:beta-phosphoglucomutase
VLTTHTARELSGADVLIKDFSEMVAGKDSFEQIVSSL